MIGCRHSRAIQVYPGLTSWVILSRPCGTGLAGDLYPALACWATFSRPFGTGTQHPDDRFVFSKCWPNPLIEKKLIWTGMAESSPGLTSWVILSRPCGTGLAGNVHPGSVSERRL
jgi:hypothetical protein